jgi:hypothetical protein
MRGTAASRCPIYLFAAILAASGAAAAEADHRMLESSESPANWTAPPFWLPAAAVRVPEAAAAGARTPLTSNPPALPFFAIAPCRLADTRAVGGGGIIHASEVRSFQVTGACNIPAAAQAVSFNFTVTTTQGPGFLVAYPFNAPFPTVSILNFVGGQTLANGAIVALASGQISTAMGSSAADLIIDVNGYYAPTGIVASVNNLTGDVSLAAGSNVTITPSGNTLTIAAPLTSLNASNVTSGVLGISFGGTGATTAAGARSLLGAATSGANADITSLSNLTTPLSVTQGGTSSTTAANARTALGAASRGANADITSLSSLTTPLSIAQGGTGSATPFASAFQARVTGTCAPGSFVVSVAADGTMQCRAPTLDPRPGFSLSTVVTSDVVERLSMAIGADGLGLIVYWDQTHQALKAAHCVDLACTSVTTSVIDQPVAYPNPSLVVGADGLGLVTYTPSNARVKTAHCNDLACSTSSTATVFTFSAYGGSSSLAIASNGLGLMTFVDATGLKFANCTNVTCSTTSVPLYLGEVNWGPSLTIGSDGLPIVAVTDTDLALKILHCSDQACSSGSVSRWPNFGAVRSSSIAVSSNGLPLVSFLDATNKLRVAYCDDIYCSYATRVDLEPYGGGSGVATSMTVGSDGFGVVVRTGGNLLVAHCNNSSCSTFSSATLEVANSQYPSVSIGSDGLPLVAWADLTTGRLKTAHCGNPFCVPYFRRR